MAIQLTNHLAMGHDSTIWLPDMSGNCMFTVFRSFLYFQLRFFAFQDPSVQRAVAGSAATNANLEDYNPFDPKQTQTKGYFTHKHFLDVAASGGLF